MKVEGDLPVVMVDAVLLQQVLTNLVCNAVKFTQQGSLRMTAGMAGENHWQLAWS